eukprot:1618225-Alexandrium_andersonii.AAC.1
MLAQVGATGVKLECRPRHCGRLATWARPDPPPTEAQWGPLGVAPKRVPRHGRARSGRAPRSRAASECAT